MSVLTDDFGKKVDLPPWKPIDITKNQLDTVAGNQEVLPSLMLFADLLNDKTLKDLENRYGLSSATMRQIGENIGSRARGEITRGVRSQLDLKSATQAVRGGYGGTDAQNKLELRNVGLFSFQEQKDAETSAINWAESARRNSYDLSRVLLNSDQRYAQSSNERDLAWKHEYLKAQIAAAPDPGTRGLMDAIRNGTMYMSGGWNGTYQTPQVGQQGGVGGGGYGEGSSYSGGGNYGTLFQQGGYFGGGGNGGGDVNVNFNSGGSGSKDLDWGSGAGQQFAGWG